MSRENLMLLLRIDSAANFGLAAGLIVFASSVTDGLGLGSAAPVWVLAAGVGVNAVWLRSMASSARSSVVRWSGCIDLAFVGLASMVALNAGAAGWLRVIAALMAVSVAIVGVAKLAMAHVFDMPVSGGVRTSA